MTASTRLFLEVTQRASGEPFILGLAHIRRIQPLSADDYGPPGTEIELGEHGFSVQTREDYETIRRALGTAREP